MLLKRLFLVGAGLFSLLLVSCGKPVCVLGMGNCNAFGTTPSPVSAISLTVSSSTLHLGQTVTLTISGGTPPYTIESSNTGMTYGYFIDPLNATNKVYTVSTSNTSVTFSAVSPSTNLAANTYPVQFNLKDSASPNHLASGSVQVISP